MLARLRAEEGISIRFMIQVDTQSYKIPEFVELASQAGCTQVFIGMESINPKNLKAAGKAQNKVQEYREMIAAWHRGKDRHAYRLHHRFPVSIPPNRLKKM